MDSSKTRGKGMKRLKVEMLDPIVAPGVSKSANVPITASPAGMACQIEVFLGPNETTRYAESGLKPFTSTGAPQTVSCPITMPIPAAGSGVAYHVYIDVYTGGFKFIAGIATEDVVIPGGSIGPIVWE